MYSAKRLILGIGGTPRPNSATERALRICLNAAARQGAETVMLGSSDLTLPLYDPSRTDRSQKAQRMLALLRKCEGLVIASPGYHGSISGLMKNALDYIEDLRRNDPPYLDGRPVGCICCAYGWQAIGSTLATMRAIIHALRGWPTPLGAGINTSMEIFDPLGNCLDKAAKCQLETVGRQVADFARLQRSSNLKEHQPPLTAF
jgi:FMN reductase